MLKILKPFVFSCAFVIAIVSSSQGQVATSPAANRNATAVSATPTEQTPDDVMKKLSDLVHAGKYAEAQQSVAALLIIYPDDQRLHKAKTLLDNTLASSKPPEAATSGNPPTKSPMPSEPAKNTTAAQLTEEDKVEYNSLIELARQAQQDVDLEQRNASLKRFMDQSSQFLQKHPDEILLSQLRASLGNPIPKPAVPDANSSAPINNPAPVAAAPASAPNTTILHVYRLKHLSGTRLNIYIDGDKITPIANGQTIRMLLAPGKHTITVSNNRINDKVPINDFPMVAGDEYWIRADFVTGFSTLIPYVKLSLVPADQAQSESSQLEEMRIGDLSRN